MFECLNIWRLNVCLSHDWLFGYLTTECSNTSRPNVWISLDWIFTYLLTEYSDIFWLNIWVSLDWIFGYILTECFDIWNMISYRFLYFMFEVILSEVNVYNSLWDSAFYIWRSDIIFIWNCCYIAQQLTSDWWDITHFTYW